MTESEALRRVASLEKRVDRLMAELQTANVISKPTVGRGAPAPENTIGEDVRRAGVAAEEAIKVAKEAIEVARGLAERVSALEGRCGQGGARAGP